MADFKLGRIKFKWRGSWATSTAYLIDDVVKYGGNTYVAIANHTSPANENLFYTSPGTYTDYWSLQAEALFFKGAYANSTWYKLNDLVTYGGKSYRCTTAHTSSSAVLDQSKFEAQIDGILIRGDYAADTQYRLGDIVKYGGRQYRCTTEHTSASTSGGVAILNTSNFSVFVDGLDFKGDWAATTYYKVNDVVKFGSFQYKCTTAHTSGANSDAFAQANFAVYSEGLDFLDTYSASTVYKQGDVVTYGGYSYVWINTEESSGQTPTDNTYWDVVTTGFKALGEYSHGTSYKTGEVVEYGGYSYVATANNTSQRPFSNTSYWTKLNEGFNWRGVYDAGITYNIGDTVEYSSSSYTTVNDLVLGVTPGTDATKWQLIAQGSTTNVLTTRGDMIVRDATQTTRLPIGISGAYLTTDGSDIKWSNAEGANVKYVANSGSDSNVGTQALPYKTINYALSQATSGDVVEIESIAGGTGGTPGTFDVSGTASQEFTVASVPSTTEFTINLATSTFAHTYVNGGTVTKSDDSTLAVSGAPYVHGTGVITITTPTHGLSVSDVVKVSGLNYTCSQGSKTYPTIGTGSKYRVTTDGSSTPTVEITDGGNGHVEGNTITIAGADIGSASALTLNVFSKSIGDVVYIKNGVYKETLPIRVPAGVTVQGESLRGTEIRPSTGTGHQVKTITVTSGGTGGTPGTYNYVHANATNSATAEASTFVANVVCDGSSTPTVTIYHGGAGFVVGNTITIPGTSLGSSSNLVLTVASLENNDASNMWLLNNQTNLVNGSFKGLTGTPGAGATGKAAVVSLDPSGTITTVSPYVQNCSSVNAGVTGVQIDGLLHSAGNKSILGNDFTQINSDGIGVHALGGGRAEMVSVFTYYCDKSFYAQSGGVIRGANCSSGYGEQGAVADGSDADETVVSVITRGEQLFYQPATISTGSTSDIDGSFTTNGSGTATIVGNTSGATATFFRHQISKDTIYIENRSGNFQQGEVITITKEDSTTFTVTLSATTGDSTAAQIGQMNALIAVKSADGTLGSSLAIPVGANIRFAGNSTYYRVGAVTETNTTNQTATVRLTLALGTAEALAVGTATTITNQFSQVRLTGHDFLDIGTGDFATTNYPGGPSQSADQDDEVTETNGGRVYFSSTDQNGDFRVGDLFRIQQSTGIATLNADAFDLSGLSELQLGSIGAEIGATINEFSTDETLGGDSLSSVPVEKAVFGFLKRDKMGTDAMVPPTGTTAQRPTGDSLFTGAIRYNSSLVTWEGYNGSAWTGLGGGNPWASTSTNITIAANDRYFVDTSGGAKTITLPASPQTGDQVSLLDLAGTFDTNNLTIARNSLKIMGQAADMTVSTEDAGIQLVYTGATYGWKLISNI